MKKRLLAILLTLCMLIGLLPATALAAGDETPTGPVLDISKGSITITNYGYKLGDDAEILAWGDSNPYHELTITGSSEAGEDIYAATNMIEIQGGNPTIILKDVTITMNSDVSAADRFRPAVVLRENQTATIKLAGVNKLTGGDQAPGIQINKDATLTIEGEGTLNTSGKNHAAGIGTGRNNKYAGNNNTNLSGGSLVIESGTITAAAGGGHGAGIGASHSMTFKNITIEGGTVTTSGGNIGIATKTNAGTNADTSITIAGGTVQANGTYYGIYTDGAFTLSGGKLSVKAGRGANGSQYAIKAGSVSVSGGTITSLAGGNIGNVGHDPIQIIGEDTVSITGGNIGNYYSGAEKDGRTLTKLAFFDENGTPKAKTEVTVTEGGHEWTALTDENGMVTTYLGADTKSVSATFGEGGKENVAISNGLGVAGASCTCAANPGTLAMTTQPQTLTVTGESETLELAAAYTKGSCVLPEGFHGDYENISYDFYVVKNGQYMTVGSYAKVEDSTLTVYPDTNADPYTVYVKAVSGPEGGKTVESGEIAIQVETYVAAEIPDGSNTLDIGLGSIEITAGIDGKTVYTQGGKPLAVDANHQVTITGSTGANTITVKGGNPTIVLKDVTMTMSGNNQPAILLYGGTGGGADLAADATIILKGTNTLAAGSAPAIQINTNAILTIRGDGSLSASTSGINYAAIGASNDAAYSYAYTDKAGELAANRNYGAGGQLVVESGTIFARGKGRGTSGVVAGIGQSYYNQFSSVTIKGGVVQATNTSSDGRSITANQITIEGGLVEAQGTEGIYANTAFSMSGGTLTGSGGLDCGENATVSITGGNVNGYYDAAIEDHTLTKLYFVNANGTPKANTEVTVKEGEDGTGWTARTDENGVVTTYLADGTGNLTIDEESVAVQNGQALIGGTCSCTTVSGIQWAVELPESITLHNLTAGEAPVNMEYDLAAELTTDRPCAMPVHPSLPAVSYSLSVTKDGSAVSDNTDDYAQITGSKLYLKPTNAPYTVTLTAKVGEGDAERTVSHSITVEKGDATGDVTTINLGLGDAVINYNSETQSYTYTQGTTINGTLTGIILLTGDAASDTASVTVNGGTPTLIINQNDPDDVWTLYDNDAEKITLQPRSFNNKLRFGTMGSTMPELSYVSAAPKLKLNPDQGDITFNADGSVTQGNFTITQLKNNEEIAIWGADLDAARTVTNNSGKSLSVELNGEDVTLAEGEGHAIPAPKYANQNTSNPTTKTYIFDNGDGTYSLIAVGEGDASAPALANEEQNKISKALLDDDFSGTLYANGFLFYTGLSELHAEQFSNIQVYTSTLGHVYLGAGLTDLSWGNYCATTGFTVDPDNPYFATDEKGVLYSKDYTTLYVIPSRLRGDYTTHEACTTVNANATMMVALDSLTLGKNVSSVTGGSGSYVFFANNLKAINVEAGNAHFASKDGILYNKDMTTILACPRNVQLPDNTLEIPATVTAVEEYIFSSVNIQKLVIPEGASISGGRGLYRMTGLTEIQMLGSYGGSIAEGDGYRMDQLKKVTVADGYNFSGNTFNYSSMEWIKDAGITVTGGENTPYDGQEHSVTVTASDDTLKVEYSTNGETWSGTAPRYTVPGTYTIYWRITKPADDSFASDRELYSSRTFTITELEADESWFTLTAVKPDNPGEDFTPVKLEQPTAAPPLDSGYTVKYSEDGTGEATAEVPTKAGSYLVTVEITGEGYRHDELTLGYYTILSANDSGKKVLSFVTNGGRTIKPIIAAVNASITAPANPTRDGYDFDGWYKDVTLRTKVENFPAQMPNEHDTYYAKWIRETYEITYILAGGTNPGNPTAYTVETNDFTLKAPTRPGYQFTGWTWSEQAEPQTTVTVSKGSTGDKTYTANWEIIIYTIRYENYVTGDRTTYTINDTLSTGIALANPGAREGYTFAGWTMVVDGVSYLLPATGAEIPQGTLGDITLSGIWLAEGQTLTLDANGGQFEGGATTLTISADYGSELAALTEPTREGYTFAGWYNEPECTTVFTPPATMPLTKTIYAKWEPIPTEPSGPSGGGGGGGGSVTRYEVSAPAADNGKVTVSPASASKGQTVTVTVTPDAGYELASLTVTDKDGKAVTLTDKGDGKYTFTMPGGKVTVTARFRAVEPTPVVLPFTDVAQGAWYYDAVVYAYQNGLMEGTGDATFAPGMTTTRSMLATLLYRLEGEPAVSGGAAFTDVPAGAWYTDAVAWAAREGVVNGVGDGTAFAPDAAITREQMAVMLYRYAQYKGYDVTASADLSGYTDAGAVSDYARYAMDWAVAAGLITGTSDTTLSPQGQATRAEIATILMRFCERYVTAE